MLSHHLLGSFALDQPQFLLLPSDEQRILKDKHFVVLLDFVKVVHVELTYKGREVSMSEVFRQYLFGEVKRVNDDKADTILIP